MSPWHDPELTPSTAHTEYSIYWVLLTPRTAASQHRISPTPSQSLISRQTMLYSILYILTITSWPMNRVSTPMAPNYCLRIDRLQVLLPFRSIMTFNYISKLARSWSRSASLCSLNDSLQMYLQTRLITPSKWIFKLARLQTPSVAPDSLDYGLQVRMTMASKCISKFTPSEPPSAFPNSLDYSLQVRTIMASKCISKLARSHLRSVSLSSLDHGVVKHWSWKTYSPSSTLYRILYGIWR